MHPSQQCQLFPNFDLTTKCPLQRSPCESLPRDSRGPPRHRGPVFAPGIARPALARRAPRTRPSGAMRRTMLIQPRPTTADAGPLGLKAIDVTLPHGRSSTGTTGADAAAASRLAWARARSTSAA